MDMDCKEMAYEFLDWIFLAKDVSNSRLL